MKLPRDISGTQAVKALQCLGFSITRQVGSHVRMAKAEKRTTVPFHRTGTLQSILRQAGVSVEEFMDVL